MRIRRIDSSPFRRTVFALRSAAKPLLTSRSLICPVRPWVIDPAWGYTDRIHQGIIAHEGSSGKPGDVELVESLVNSYIIKPSCLILLTVSCESRL
jgi:hypothetical protein